MGVGIPGTVVQATGLVKNANSTWLNGQPLERDLASALGRPVRCANDANCLAVSEATDGAAAGAGLVFAVILGTGCGGGVAVERACACGAERSGGRVGAQSAAVGDGGRVAGAALLLRAVGCIETWISGTGLAKDHAARIHRTVAR